MYCREYTPERISALKSNEIFVFGSNLSGAHGGGAALAAYRKFGAIWGQGVGLQGRSYGIPTMQGGVDTIRPYVKDFIEFAKSHHEYKFLVTRIGCGIAGFHDEEIAPLFADAIDIENIILPREFVKVIQQQVCTQDSNQITWNEGKNQQQPSEDGTKALKMWTMGAGNSAKRISGENPMPEKKTTATKDSWKNLPMPEQCAVIPMKVEIPAEAMRIVKYGHIPEEMEDHWFMYCNESTIRYFRSWTGICIFIAKYEESGNKCLITELIVNRDPSQYGGTDNEKDTSLFMALLTEEYGGDASLWWKRALK